MEYVSMKYEKFKEISILGNSLTKPVVYNSLNLNWYPLTFCCYVVFEEQYRYSFFLFIEASYKPISRFKNAYLKMKECMGEFNKS